RVVRAELDGVVTAHDAWLRPVQLVGAALVAHPVGVGIPERAGLEGDHPPPRPGQTLGEDGTPGPAADDHQVDLAGAVEAPHATTEVVVRAGAVVREQPGRG